MPHMTDHSPSKYIFPNGDELTRSPKSLVLSFAGQRKVLGTSPLHGGYNENLACVFNYDEKPKNSGLCQMRAKTYEEHLSLIAEKELCLDPSSCSGLSTAADMENLAIETMEYQYPDGFSLFVTAIVTGGIDKNGARAGDPACWAERGGEYAPVPGTINIFLHVNAHLTDGAMARILMTSAEAKAAAVGELLCPSLYSSGIATGSGTDGMILVCDPASPVVLTAAGKDSKLGEMAGRTVLKGVKKAIGLQTGVTPASQHHALRRLARFGLDETCLYGSYQGGEARKNGLPFDFLRKEEFFQKADPLLASGYWTGKASLLAHLLDQLAWGMLKFEEIADLCRELFPKAGAGSAPPADTGELLELYCKEFLLANGFLSG